MFSLCLPYPSSLSSPCLLAFCSLSCFISSRSIPPCLSPPPLFLPLSRSKGEHKSSWCARPGCGHHNYRASNERISVPFLIAMQDLQVVCNFSAYLCFTPAPMTHCLPLSVSHAHTLTHEHEQVHKQFHKAAQKKNMAQKYERAYTCACTHVVLTLHIG